MLRVSRHAKVRQWALSVKLVNEQSLIACEILTAGERCVRCEHDLAGGG